MAIKYIAIVPLDVGDEKILPGMEVPGAGSFPCLRELLNVKHIEAVEVEEDEAAGDEPDNAQGNDQGQEGNAAGEPVADSGALLSKQNQVNNKVAVKSSNKKVVARK